MEYTYGKTAVNAGTGIVSIVFHTTNSDGTGYAGSLNYYGSTTSSLGKYHVEAILQYIY